MNEQAVILVSLIVGLGVTLCLYVWKATKAVEYKKDERWQLIQNKANAAANLSNYVLIVLAFAGSIASLYSDIQIAFTLNRVSIYIMLFIGLRNAIELLALMHFNKRL
ncbi:MAG: hypothetical protein FWC60_10440 [Firmicutes bacterium]|nr:hypothetical protein [Bacillota bacterium]